MGDRHFSRISGVGVVLENPAWNAQRQANIAGLVHNYKARSTDLLAIIAANRVSKRFDLIPKVKLMLKATELKQAVTDLDNTAASVDRFTRTLLSNRQTAKSTPSSRSAKLAKALKVVHSSAADLYLALHDSWEAGCHVRHEVNLLLEDRVEIIKKVSKRSSQNTPVARFVFHLTLAAHLCQEKSLSYETAVQVYERDAVASTVAHRKPSFNHHATASTQVTLAGPQLTPPATPDVIMVDNICRTLESASGVKRRACFVLAGDQRVGVSMSDDTPIVPFPGGPRKVTLRELLLLGTNSRYNVPLKFRMLLALRLSSNLLQLLHTNWLQAAWSKDTVYFPLQQGTKAKEHDTATLSLIDLNRPFVCLAFDEKEAIKPPCPLVNPKVALLELGILLLEIWHQQSFEARFGLEPAAAPGGYYTRLAMAIEWLDDTTNPMPEQYDKAVSLCTRGVIGGESHFANWDDDIGFWAAISEDIIDPLLKNCKLWKGT